jgi:hypothetical protein
MKIRIKGNTVRYRLTKSDIAILVDTGKLEDKTEFIGSSLVYAIQTSFYESLSADFIANTITLYLPSDLLVKWAETNQVSLENNMPLANGSHLYLLLEKDFKCIDGDVSEDQSDFFENPNLNC